MVSGISENVADPAAIWSAGWQAGLSELGGEGERDLVLSRICDVVSRPSLRTSLAAEAENDEN